MPHIFVCFFHLSYTVFNFIPKSLTKPKKRIQSTVNTEMRREKRRKKENSIKQTHNFVSHLNCSMSNIGCSFFYVCFSVCVCAIVIVFFQAVFLLHIVRSLSIIVFMCVVSAWSLAV